MSAQILVCPNCQSPRAPGATACPACGADYPPPFQSSSADAYNLPPASRRGPGGPAIAVVGVLVILFVIAAGTIISSSAERSRRKALGHYSSENLHQLGLLIQEYEQDHNDNLPAMDSIDSLKASLQHYYQNETESGVFVEPVSHRPYLLNSGMSHLDAALLNHPEETELAREPQARQDGTIAVLYADGVVKVEKASAYDAK